MNRHLWVPKKYIDVNSVKSALTYEVPLGYNNGAATRLLYLYKESEHHLLIPREFWKPAQLPCRVVDCRPQVYPHVAFRSRIKLDHQLAVHQGQQVLIPTGNTIQTDALSALLQATGGVLQLACGRGKAQPVDTPVPTSTGWTCLGRLRAGDFVLGSDGRPTRVLSVHPQGLLPIFRVTMEDGTSTRCCAEHLWFTQTPNDRRAGRDGQVRSLEEIRQTLRTKAGAQHAVPRTNAVQFAPSTLVFEPWLMGFYLGDGSSGVYNGARRIQFDKDDVALHQRAIEALARHADHAELLPPIARDNNRTTMVRFDREAPGAFWSVLQACELVGVDSLNKFIPAEYLFSSVAERWELLQGLLDSDGSITPTARSISTSAPKLAEGIVHLARSLGCRVYVEPRQTFYTYNGEKKAGAPSFRIHLNHPRWGKGRYEKQYIQSIEPCGTEECVCIRVEAADQLYVTENFIVTHNTVVTLELIARLCVPTIVFLDNIGLLYQWEREAKKFLDIPGGIGVVGDGKKEWDRNFVLATYHSGANYSEDIPEKYRRHFGLIVYDEGHHASAPDFSKTADMFYGQRFSLTATPKREDGLNVLSDGHVGPVVYKNLVPMMTPRFGFLWSGVSVDLKDPRVRTMVADTKGELHLSKLNGFFGQHPARVNFLMSAVAEARKNDRMILVLSTCVAEVVNLVSLMERPGHPLYTDIPIPTPTEIGEQGIPELLNPKMLKKVMTRTAHLEKLKTAQAQAELAQLYPKLQAHKLAMKVQNEYMRRQRAYILELVNSSKTCGLLTYEVDPKLRQEFLEKRNIIFAITKYGKEGLDCPRLDTVLLSALFSSKNGLQQLMGRPTRPRPGKKTPTLGFIVDDVALCIGMARKLINHLRSWPNEEGGPYEPILIGFPPTWRTRTPGTIPGLFGP